MILKWKTVYPHYYNKHTHKYDAGVVNVKNNIKCSNGSHIIFVKVQSDRQMLAGNIEMVYYMQVQLAILTQV